ncbi:phage baseplate plug protein [Mangrovibacter phragmitis]|uniref:phage baseplate plug family protein n=1 Tax=Mangrovibacter phragmitis TaxID=1691903 RepID=UPI0038620F6D
MTTTTYTFTGDEQSAVSFTPTLDGTVYNCSIGWNIAAQRWYLTVKDGSGNRVLTRAVTGSPVGADINLLFGVFTSTTMVWRTPDGKIEVTS